MSKNTQMASRILDPFLTPATLAMALWPNGDEIWLPRKHLTYASARIAAAITGKSGRLIVSMPPRHGKQCADDTPVLTTKGWKTHGTLNVGDYVFSPSGKPVKVLAISEPSLAEWEVEFTNGQVIQCHFRHDWTLFDRRKKDKLTRKLGSWRVVETSELVEKTPTEWFPGDRAQFSVPLVEPLQFPAQFLEVDPYTLGAWLGDGSKGKATLTGSSTRGKLSILEAVGAVYPVSSKWTHKDTGVHTWSYTKLKELLHKIGVLTNKRIPEIYLRASIEQRLQLLAGLIDTDGSVDPQTNRVRFVGANKVLIDDVCALVRTFGWYVSLSSAEPALSTSGVQGVQTIWTIGFNPTCIIPTKVVHKSIDRVLEERRRVGVAAVRSAAIPKVGRCIQVDSADGLYLVGRLLIPTHNSRLISEATIPWFLEKFPGKNVMFVAYNGDFAEEWGGKAKDIINARQDLFSFKIRDDRSRVDRFETSSKSTCWFTGINGGQTGKGAHLVIIDDYIKDIEQAMSRGERDKMWDKFIANIWTRLEPGATIIIVATRWWSDDLIGRILKHLKGWENICFPGVYRPLLADGRPDLHIRDLLGRKYGEVLFPERYPIERMGELQAAMKVSGTIFEALVQQTPIDDQTNFTDGKWLQVISGAHPEEYTCCRAWDMAATQGGGDYTTGTKMGRKGLTRQAYLFNIIRKQLSPAKVEETIRATAVADGPECTVILEQEPGSQGEQLVAHYKTNVLSDFRVVAVPAGNKSKIIKAQPFIASVESGNVYMVDNTNALHDGAEPDWMKHFREEFGAFPPSSGGHDDQVDTAAMCYNHLFQTEIKSVAWGQQVASGSRVAFGLGSYAAIPEDELENVKSLNALFANGGKHSGIHRGVVWGSRNR